MERIGVNRDTLELSGHLSGHRLDYRCDQQEIDQVKLHNPKFAEKLEKLGGDLWRYDSTMPLSGQGGYAIVTGEYVVDFTIDCLH